MKKVEIKKIILGKMKEWTEVYQQFSIFFKGVEKKGGLKSQLHNFKEGI